MDDKFDAAYKLRQKILDFLNANPGEYSTTEISDKTGFCRDYVCRAIRSMVEKEEVKRHGPKWNAKYTPLQRITFLAEKARTSQRSQQAKEVKKPEPWVYVHKHTDTDNGFLTLSGGDAPRNTHQGGQGNVRGKVTIKSCMG